MVPLSLRRSSRRTETAALLCCMMPDKRSKQTCFRFYYRKPKRVQQWLIFLILVHFFGKEISRGTASFPLYNLQTERCLSVATEISFAIIRIGNLLRTETGERPERKLQALSVWESHVKTGKEPRDKGNPRGGLLFGNAAAAARSRQNAGSIPCAPAAESVYRERAEI